MTEIYRQAWRLYRSALPALLAFALLVAALDVFVASSSASNGALVGQLFILYYFHRSCLFGEGVLAFGKPGPDAPPLKFGGFMVISLALIFVPVGISVVLALSVWPGSGDSQTLIGAVMLYLGPLYLIALSLFGTALPASVARPDNFQMSKGIKATFGTMWRLILGPGVAVVVLFGLLIAMGYLLADNAAFQSPAGQFVAMTLAGLVGYFPSLLGVVVLCQMYHRIMGTDVPAPAEAFS